MVISIHPQHMSGDPGVSDSLSYRWLVTMPAANGDKVDPKTGSGGGADGCDLEFEFLLSPSQCSPPPADQIIAGGLLLPFRRSRDHRDKDKTTKSKKSACYPDCAITRSLSVNSSFSSSYVSSSRSSSASSASSASCSSDVPLKPKRRFTTPIPPVSLPHPRQKPQISRHSRTLASLLQKIAQLVVAACRRAKALRYTTAFTTVPTKGSANSRRDHRKTPYPALKGTKKGPSSIDRFSSALLLCRPDHDAGVESSIHEAIQYCKRSHGTAHSRSQNP